MNDEHPETSVKQAASGADSVLRGMMLLALMIILAVGGYAIYLRRPAPPPPAVASDPIPLIPLVVQPAVGFPGTVSWPALFTLADQLPSSPGWQTRYQAARNLAFLGSSKVPWDVYRELLDERRQFCNFRARLDDGRIVVEEAAARQIMLGALKDLAVWHAKHPRIAPDKALHAVYLGVDLLAQSPIAELKAQAEKTRAVFFR